MSMQIMSIRVKESKFLMKWNIWMVRPSVGLSILPLKRVLSHVCAHVMCVCGVSVWVHGECACVRTPPTLRSPLACPLQFDGSSLWDERCRPVTATQHQRTVQWLSSAVEVKSHLVARLGYCSSPPHLFWAESQMTPIPYIVYYFWTQWTQIEPF